MRVKNNLKSKKTKIKKIGYPFSKYKQRIGDLVYWYDQKNEKNPLLPKLSLIKFKEQLGCQGAIRAGYKKTYIK